MPATPFVVCRACGHQYSSGGFFAYGPIDDEIDPDDLTRLERDAQVQLRRQGHEILRRAGFAVYVVRGLDWHVAGWGGSYSATMQLTIGHGAEGGGPGPVVTVQTEHAPEVYESDRTRARAALEAELGADQGEWPERSRAGLSVLLHVRDRQRRFVAARATCEQRTLLVDGEPLSFAFTASGSRWVAVRRHGELVVTIAARDVDPDAVQLVAVAAGEYRVPDG